MDPVAVTNLVFTGVVAVSTVVYAVLTHKLVKETTLLRRAGSEPHVAVFVEPSARGIGFLELEVKNVGSGPAYDVGCGLKGDWQVFPKNHAEVLLSGLGLFTHGIKYLAPGQVVRTFVGKGEDLARRDSYELPVTVRYRNHAGEETTTELIVSFAHLSGFDVDG